MLTDVKDSVAEYAAFLAEVIKADIEIVNDEPRKLAAHGLCAASERLIAGGAIYKAVFETGLPVYIQNPRQHSVCGRCALRSACLEYMELAVPIKTEDAVIGAIGLLCSSRAQREQIVGNTRAYLFMLDSVAKFLAERAADKAAIKRLSGDSDRPVRRLADVERDEINLALSRFGTDTAGKRNAAKALGIGLSTLYRKLEEQP